jgi:carbon monoxide dehydrogenase subunit G
MTTQRHQVSAHIKNKPEAVLAFIADVRNRTRYIPSLKSLTDVTGNPAGTGTTWKWKFAILGTEVEGTGRSLKYEPGKAYSFMTEGGIKSTWNYQVAPDGDGTQLTVVVEFEVPEKMKAHMPPPATIEAMKKAEGELVMTNLKALLEA